MEKRLNVGNLEYSTTNEELEKLFSSEGTVTTAKVIRTLEGKSKGFGFVEMETVEEATKAAEKYDQSNYKDRILSVSSAKPQVHRGFDGGRRGQRQDRKPRDDLNSKLRRLRKKF